MTDHREQNSTCPMTWEEEPRGFLTEWEATPLKPTEDAKMGNDEAERLADRHRNVLEGVDSGRNGNGELCDVAVSLIRATEPMLRTQAARIAELDQALSDALSAHRIELERRFAAEAEVARLREAIRHAHDTLYELNPSNYDHDEVCRVNDASVEVILALAPLLGETHGKTPEWWDASAAFQRKSGELVMQKVGQGDGNTYTVSVEGLQAEIARLTAALAEAEALGYARGLEDAATKVEANRAHLNFNAMLQLLRDDPLPEPVVVAVSKLLDGIATAIRALAQKEAASDFPPPHCTAWEDCNHDGVCHDPGGCGAVGPNALAADGEA